MYVPLEPLQVGLLSVTPERVAVAVQVDVPVRVMTNVMSPLTTVALPLLLLIDAEPAKSAVGFAASLLAVLLVLV